MICSCGTEIEDDISYCGHCGADITVETLLPDLFCGECGSAVFSEYDFCPDCGATLKKISAPTTEKPESESKPETQTSNCLDEVLESQETVASSKQQKSKKNKRGAKLVILTIIAYALIIVSVFCYLYICLHGWEAIPFIDYIKFLPFVGN